MWPVVERREERREERTRGERRGARRGRKRGEERKEERVLLPPALRIYKSRLAKLVRQIDRRKADMH